MCGIFCAFGLKGKSLPENIESVKNDAKLIMHSRGPDYFGYYISNSRNSAIFHSRLAIRGLDKKYNQPYKCSDGSLLAYNGEIYSIGKSNNWGLGVSDTDAFSKHIIKVDRDMSEVDGMYAYVRYNPEEGIVWIGRDLFGEKTLYTLRHEDYLFIFSEVKYLKIAELMINYKRETCTDFLSRFIAYGYRQLVTENGITPWKGVNEIRPASEVKIYINTGVTTTVSTDSIYKMYMNKEGTKIKTDKVSKMEIISEYVSYRSASDVNTGISLSGGIDSNLVASIMNRCDTPPTHAFTICSDDTRYSEFDISREGAKNNNLKHIPVQIGDKDECPIESFLELTNIRQSPFLTMSSFVSCYVAREASRKGIKVMFSGIGGDEFFSGYYDYFYYRMLSSDYSKDESDAFKRYVLPNIKNPVMSKGPAGVNLVSQLQHHYPHLFIRNNLFRDDSYIPILSEPTIPNTSRLRSRMFADLTHDVIPVILHEDDINFMTFSVENRSPLLSKQILLLSLSLKDSELMENGYQKIILRKMLKELSPKMSSVYNNRRKQGYNYGILDLYRKKPKTFLSILYAETILWDLIKKQEVEKTLIMSDKLDEMLLFAIFSIQSFLLNTHK